ncbi:MAG TPA: rhomboid family intramembrane serine protease [Planctomycetota bacterium]|jgi:membrane associated rhomboid family serine protease|nr:rhomboid family intramembrane serine protease [Planctomycetota bacterium]
MGFDDREYARPGGGGGPGIALPRVGAAVKFLLAANLGIFVFCFVVFLVHPPLDDWLHRMLGLNTELWRAGIPAVWQLLTGAFLHTTSSPMHVLYNMLLLYFFGTMLEGLLGARRFVVFYLGAALAGSLLSLCLSLVLGQAALAYGASGAVMGVVVAAATLRPKAQVLLLFIPMTLGIMAIGIVAIDLFQGVAAWKNGINDGVAHSVHLGGAAWGFLAVKAGIIWRDPIEGLRARKAMRAEEQRRGADQRMDDLLAKIHREGMGSLSRAERDFLQSRSKRK